MITPLVMGLAVGFATLLAFNIGYEVADRRGLKQMREERAESAYAVECEREQAAFFRQMVVDLQRQLVRIQRATVSLPEVGPPDLKVVEEEPPPEELVKICAAFGDEGVRLLTQARRQRRAGISWSYITAGLRSQIEQQNPQAMEIINGLG